MSQTKRAADSDVPEGYGQEERSVAKLPFTVLGRGMGRNGSMESLEARWQSKIDGKTVNFFRTVTPSLKFGLPDFPAEEVYIGLLYFAARENFASREIRVRPRRLLELMGWPVNGNAYTRLKLSLNQLKGVMIHTNALFDNETKQYDEGAFGILDTWKIRKAAKDAPLFGEEAGDLLIVTWNSELYKQFGRGRLRLLNVRQYYEISAPIAKRLYRYLDEALYPTGRTEIDVVQLAHVRLELSRARTSPSLILASMRRALDELAERGICTWEMVPSQTPSGKKFIFTRIEKEEAAKAKRGKEGGAKAAQQKPDVEGTPALQPAHQNGGRLQALRAQIEAMGEEERESLERQAVGRLDTFNQVLWREKGRASHGVYNLLIEHMGAILGEQHLTAAP